MAQPPPITYAEEYMILPQIPKKIFWLPILGLLVLGGATCRIIAAGGLSSAATSNNLRQPIADTNGLVAWYPLDGDAKDYSGNSNNGVLLNSPQYVNGKFGKGLSLNNTSSQGLQVNSVSYPLTNAFSVSLWFNPNPTQPGYARLFELAGSGKLINLQNSGGIYFRIDTSGGSNQSGCNAGTGIVGQWNNLVGTIASNGTTICYLNGKQVSTALVNIGTGLANSGTLYVGTAEGTGLNGYIDDFRIYNHALSQVEVTSIYAGSPSQSCDQYCKVWLKLDDNAGTSPADSSGNGNTGTTSGTVTWTTGNFASALKLDGSTGSISLPNLGLNSGTVDMWINPTSVSGDQHLFTQLTGASSQAGQLDINQSSGESGSLWVWDGSAWQRLSASGSLTAGAWNHIVVTNSGGTATAYINGTQQLTAVAGFNFNGGNSGVGAKFLGTTGGTFNGIVDDFRVYSRILAPEEIADQWQQGT
jgi:hypothetical protein